MKRLVAIVLCLLIIFTFPVIASANNEAPTDSFTHWDLSNGQKYPVKTKALYNSSDVISARSLGVDDFGVIVDIDSDENGDTYVLTDSNKIFSFDKENNLVKDYEIIDTDGKTVDFKGAKGIYVFSQNIFYIADTEHNRVLKCENGVIKTEITLPKSPLIPNDFVFKPTNISIDSDGFLYVLSSGSYYGAILYTPQLEFSGFFGANTVKGNILSSLQYLWDRLTMNDAKRAKVSKTLPYQFSDITIDENGFVYTCTGLNADDSIGQIRILSPGGDGILSGAESKNFGESDHVKRLDKEIRQNFVSIEADGQGLIYALDSAFGLVYIYDNQGKMISAFGGGIGQGRQTGVFTEACSMTLSGNDILVADSVKNSITRFKRTEFGTTLLNAQIMTLNSNFTDAKPLWNEILKVDPVNKNALYGLAKEAYQSRKYNDAMKYSKSCGDSEIYSKARAIVQNNYVTDNFLIIFLIAIAVIAALSTLLVFSVKKQVVLIKNDKIRTMVKAPIHPFQSFNDIKYKKQGSITIAVILTILFYFSGAASAFWCDFRYSSYDSESYNTFYEILRTVGLILIWSVANWGISTLREGKGRLKEVFVVTAYSVFPMIIYNIFFIPLTYVVSTPNSALIQGIKTVALILCGICLTVGLMIIHDFSFFKFLITAIISVLFIILIIFVIFMIGVLLSQFAGFFKEVILEGMRRW